MQLTHFGHSCVRLHEGDRALVIDPGVFSEVAAALDGVHEVLITHEHPDHVDVEFVRAAAQRDPRLRVWAPDSTAATFADLGEQFVGVASGQSLDVGGFAVQTFGGQHAVIHPSIPVISNVTYLVDGAVYHPGDSFAVPTADVSTLLLPIHAPWSKISEVIDFAIAIRAGAVHQIHDAMLNEIGLGMVEGHLTRIGAQYGSHYRHLKVGESTAA
jgi:L-ascorbate metabolism protein UlaG (beta-lactamase superfamily)